MTFTEETAEYLAYLRRMDSEECPTHGIFAGIQAGQTIAAPKTVRRYSRLLRRWRMRSGEGSCQPGNRKSVYTVMKGVATL
jgi:hypothetical protein